MNGESRIGRPRALGIAHGGSLGRALVGVFLLLSPAGLFAGQVPVIDEYSANPAVVAPGGVAVLTLAAHDPDCPDTCTTGCGQYIRSDLTSWSATGGTFLSEDNGVSASPYNASAQWQAPDVEGSHTISVYVSDSGGFMCGGAESVIVDLDIVVTLSSNEPPVVDSLTANPMQLFPGQTSALVCVASDPDGDALVYSWDTDSGSVLPGPDGTATFTAGGPGIATVTCTATDTGALPGADSIGISVTGAVAEQAIRAGLTAPRRLSVDSMGDVYVVDGSGGISVVHLQDGELIYRIPLPGVTSVAVDWADNLLVGRTDDAWILDRHGTALVALSSVLGDVSDVAVDQVNRRYGVLHKGSGTVEIFDETGAPFLAFGSTGDNPEQFKGPLGLAAAPGGRWVVADTGHGLIKVFDANGTLLSSFGGPGGGAGEFVRLDDVAVDSAGVIYASDSYQDWVQAFNPDGTAREVLGTYGDEIGQFKTPTGIAPADDFDRLVVGSLNSSSLQVFRTSDDPVTFPPPPSPVLSAGNLAFGEQAVGGASPVQSLTLTNVGGYPLGLHEFLAQGDFAQTNDCGGFLDSGQSCVIDVVFRPTAAGIRNGALIVDTNGEPARIAASLSGEASVAAPQLRLSPGLLVFADQEVGTVSEVQSVGLTNTGSAAVEIIGIQTSADYLQGNNCPGTLAAGSACSIDVRFAPARVSDHLLGSVTVTSDAGGSPHAADLDGSSTPLVPGIDIDDPTVDEANGSGVVAAFRVTLSEPTSEPVSVDYYSLPDTAADDEDFVPVVGTLTIPTGETEGSIEVEIIGDDILEPDEETFFVELASPSGAILADNRGLGTILDDEPCVGPNLLLNPSAEDRPEGPGLPGWTQVAGSQWQPRVAPPAPIDGEAYFYAGTVEYAELTQDIDVSAFDETISQGEQWFAFEGYVYTLYEAQADSARVIVEYRSLDNSFVLDAYDTGEFSSPSAWMRIADDRPAPIGTGWIRVRLISTHLGDAYFDALSIRSLRAATVVVDDLEVREGDLGLHQSSFTVHLACPYYEAVAIDYATTDQTAVTGSDYLAAVGEVSLAVGETIVSVPVEIVGDEADENHETFGLDISLVEPTDAVLLDDEGICLIFNDDFCAQGRWYWLNYPELWPVTYLELGGVEYDQATLRLLLDYSGPDMSHALAGELVATKLNLLRGSGLEIVPVADAADAFLEQYPPGSKPNGAAKQQARDLRDDLAVYNNPSCSQVSGGGESGPGDMSELMSTTGEQ